MKFIKTYLLILISTICLFNCKKYPEDGKRSWHKPYKRIHASWKLKEYIVDGEDSINKWYNLGNTINGNIQWQMMDARFDFTDYTKKDYQNTVGKVLDIYIKKVLVDGIANCPSCYLHAYNDWSLKDKNSVVSFKTLDDYKDTTTNHQTVSYSIINNASNDNWEIKKLTDKEMILEAYSINHKHLRLKFQK